jgi:hypothetical protein
MLRLRVDESSINMVVERIASSELRNALIIALTCMELVHDVS